MPTRKEPISVNDVLSLNLRRVREQLGWSQAEVARRAASIGLPWTRSTIADLESKPPRRSVILEELMCLPMIYGSELSDLLAYSGDIWLGDSSFRGRALLKILHDQSLGTGENLSSSTRSPDETEAKAARALGVNRETVIRLALKIWGHRLVDEREKRLAAAEGDGDVSARRGHLTRQLIRELERALTW